MVAIEMSFKEVLRTNFCPTAVIVFISNKVVHMEERKAKRENYIIVPYQTP